MEISYWKNRWQQNKTGWHRQEVYPQLPRFWSRLDLPKEARVLVPLCGKSHDIDWLAEQGFQLIGVDASGKALKHIMERFPESFLRTESHGYTVFRSDTMELWQGDFLNFPKAAINPIAAVYDKASIVALPPAMRKKYAGKLLELSGKHTQIFLQSFEYDQHEMNGPPFSVSEREIKNLLGASFDIMLLHKQSRFEEVEKFHRRGLSSYFMEKIYHLTPDNKLNED